MAIAVGAMTGRLSAAATGERQRARKCVRREVEAGQKPARTAAQFGSFRACGGAEFPRLLPAGNNTIRLKMKTSPTTNVSINQSSLGGVCLSEDPATQRQSSPGPIPKTVKHPEAYLTGCITDYGGTHCDSCIISAAERIATAGRHALFSTHHRARRQQLDGRAGTVGGGRLRIARKRQIVARGAGQFPGCLHTLRAGFPTHRQKLRVERVGTHRRSASARPGPFADRHRGRADHGFHALRCPLGRTGRYAGVDTPRATLRGQPRGRSHSADRGQWRRIYGKGVVLGRLPG